MVVMNDNLDGECTSWGASKQVFEWATQKGLIYAMPTDWEMIKEINSKAFSANRYPLEGAEQLFNEKELAHWFSDLPGKKILKTCFGVSGKGNRLGEELKPSLLSFCKQEWAKDRPIIAEPWLERFFDFSTQWFIHRDGEIELLGPTVFIVDSKGSYQGTYAGQAAQLFGSYYPFLEEHLESVAPLLLEIARMGFFGHLGIDAFLYRKNGEIKLRPVVEINARETLSLAALQIQKRSFEGRNVALQIASECDPRPSLLPMHLTINGGRHAFKRKLVFSVT
jgi:hypothetical protein